MIGAHTKCDMSGTNTPNCDTPSIFSLAVRSQKALLYGKQLCQKAQELSRASTQVAAELLALNAKVLWIAQGMGEQLKVSVVAVIVGWFWWWS